MKTPRCIARGGFRVITGAEWRRRHLRGPMPTVIRDVEVLRHVLGRFGEAVTFEELAADCRQRFGAELAPSKSALCRFWEALQSGRLSPEAPQNQVRAPKTPR